MGLSTAPITGEQDKGQAKANTGPKELSEVSRLRAENFKLRTQLIQCSVSLNDREAKIQSSLLTDEQSKLTEEFRKELDAEKTDKFNWTNFTFESASSK